MTDNDPESLQARAPSRLAWLPNAVSILRILMAPLIAFLTLAGLQEGVGSNLLRVALYLFVFAALTDWLDGYLARALNAKSELGGKLDLWGDKALVGLVLIGLWLGWLFTGPYQRFAEAVQAEPLVLVSGFVLLLATSGRDFLVTVLRENAARVGRTIKPTFLAKSKTAILMTGLGVTLGGMSFVWYPVMAIGFGLVVIGAVISVITAIDYFEMSKSKQKGDRS